MKFTPNSRSTITISDVQPGTTASMKCFLKAKNPPRPMLASPRTSPRHMAGPTGNAAYENHRSQARANSRFKV